MRSPTSTAVKICGITQLNQAKKIAALGIDAIGVIGVASSKRFVSESERRRLFSWISNNAPDIQRVWVVADMNEKELKLGLTGEGSPSVVQLHGHESPEQCKKLRQKHPKTIWWKALRIRKPEDLLIANSYTNKVDALILDAWSPDELGGTGNRLPLKWLRQASIESKWWLAGGISADWIPEILSQVNPYGVDASSRLETSPGIKDLKRVEALVKILRSIK